MLIRCVPLYVSRIPFPYQPTLLEGGAERLFDATCMKKLEQIKHIMFDLCTCCPISNTQRQRGVTYDHL
jgi:hypothetical protein